MTDGSDLCTTPTKGRYATPEAAQDAIRRQYSSRGRELTMYDTCACGWIHLTSKRNGNTGEPVYTVDELHRMDHDDFSMLVRIEVTGRAHPDTCAALRDLRMLTRWDSVLRAFALDLGAQLSEKSGNTDPGTREWRSRIVKMQSFVSDRRAEVRTLRAQNTSRLSREENARGVIAYDLSRTELRALAGSRAVARLKEANMQEFLGYLLDEHEKLGIVVSNNTMKAVTKHGVTQPGDERGDTEN